MLIVLHCDSVLRPSSVIVSYFLAVVVTVGFQSTGLFPRASPESLPRAETQGSSRLSDDWQTSPQFRFAQVRVPAPSTGPIADHSVALRNESFKVFKEWRDTLQDCQWSLNKRLWCWHKEIIPKKLCFSSFNLILASRKTLLKATAGTGCRSWPQASSYGHLESCHRVRKSMALCFHC